MKDWSFENWQRFYFSLAQKSFLLKTLLHDSYTILDSKIEETSLYPTSTTFRPSTMEFFIGKFGELRWMAGYRGLVGYEVSGTKDYFLFISPIQGMNRHVQFLL